MKPGGTLIYDPYGIHRLPSRTDINIVRIDAMEATFDMASAKAYNMVVLGALLKVKPLIPVESVIRGLKKTLPERHHHLLPMNEAAIARGAQLV